MSYNVNNPEHILPPTEIVIVDLSVDDHVFGDTPANPPLRAISFVTAGNLKVDTPNSTAKTIPNGALAAGVQHVLVITRIYKTGTLAANIVGYR